VSDGRPDPDEAARRAASLWHERFEQPRRARGLSPFRQRLLAGLLLLLAAALLLYGLTERGHKLRDLASPGTPPLLDAARLSRELALDPAGGQLFFPLWETWLRQDRELAALRTERLGTLATLSAQRQDLNAEQERLLDELGALDARRRELRTALLEDVHAELGLWRAARLAVLLEGQGR